MLKKLSSSGATRFNYKVLLEALIFCLILGVAILDGMANLTLNQDSATYIEVAHRILISGHLETMTGSTNFIYAPGLKAYISQPPGFPFLLVPFIAVLKDPMLAALAAQEIFILLFYLAIYLLMLRLEFRPLLRVAALLLFTFVSPFLFVHRRIATETIFITLSIAAAFVAIALLTRTNRKSPFVPQGRPFVPQGRPFVPQDKSGIKNCLNSNKDWILFGALVALSSMVRYTGLANLALVAPLVLKRDTLRAAWRLITHRYTWMGILATGGLIFVFAWLSDVLLGTPAGMGRWQLRGVLAGAAGMIIGAAGLGVLWLRRPARKYAKSATPGTGAAERQVSLWPLLTFLACLLPTLGWFARNKVLFGGISPANNLLGSVDASKFWDPVYYVWNDLLATNAILRPILALFFIVCLVFPFLRLERPGETGFRKTAQVSLLLAAGGHLVLLWFLSIVTKIEPIRWRLFSPILAFGMLSMLNGIQSASESLRLQKWKVLIAATPLVFLLLSGPFSIPDFIQSAGRINYPVERQLWSEIDKLGWTHSSSYFYSDYAYSSDGYLHEIFSNKLQGLLWDKNALRDPAIVEHILTGGVNPFILVTESGSSALVLDRMITNGTLPLEKITFADTGFVLYYLPQK